MDVSASGLSVQRARMDLISQNIANVNTTKTEDGTPYRRQTLSVSAEKNSFANYFSDAQGAMKAVINGVQEDLSDFERKYDPSNPDADADGYVLLPNVSIVEEMVDMISATRSYEANTTAMDASKNMAMQAINIGN
jgi:flagellar basal-body rod protein FlgC